MFPPKGEDHDQVETPGAIFCLCVAAFVEIIALASYQETFTPQALDRTIIFGLK